MTAKYPFPALALFLGLVIGQNATASTLLNLGRDRAIEDCSACHQVTASQKVPSPVADPDNEEWVPAPSFAQVAEKYKGHERELRAFIVTPDHPMKEQEFLDTDLKAIIAYINSLAKKQR
jgi:mono/diheme cytochrome c family protein